MVGRSTAARRRRRRLRGDPRFGPGRLPAPRCGHRDALRGRGRSRRGCRGPADHVDQPRRPVPHAGGDQLRRGGPQPPPRRSGSSGLRQALPGDRIPARPPDPAVPPPASRAGSEADLGPARPGGPGGRGHGGRSGRVRDRPGQIPGPGPLCGSPCCSGFRSCPIGDRRAGPRPRSQPAPPGPARPGRIRRPCLRHCSGRRPRRGGGPGPPVQ